jgi:hypothetical protein
MFLTRLSIFYFHNKIAENIFAACVARQCQASDQFTDLVFVCEDGRLSVHRFVTLLRRLCTVYSFIIVLLGGVKKIYRYLRAVRYYKQRVSWRSTSCIVVDP